MSKIIKIKARQVFDSRGNPTIEAEVFCKNLSESSICPSGASTGTYEAYGIENQINYHFNNSLSLTNSFSIAQSKYRAGHRRDFDLTGVPAFKNNTDIIYKLASFLDVQSSIYYQSSQRMINDEENYQVLQPGYYLVDLGFKGSSYGFDYSMMFNNVLDKNYYQYAVASTSSYNVYNTYPLEGFNMMFTLNKSF